MAKHALIIGSTYDHPPGVANDILCVSKFLSARGFEVEVPMNGAATRTEILRSYDALIARVEPQDTVVIYYAGHGGVAINSQYVPGKSHLPQLIQYICPSDYDRGSGDDFRGISSFELSLQLAALTRKTHNVTVIFDCCYAAQLSRAVGNRGQRPRSDSHLTQVGWRQHLQRLQEQSAKFEAVALTGNPHAVRIVAAGETDSAWPTKLPATSFLRALDPRIGRSDGLIGALTLALLEILHEIGDAAISWRAIAAALRSRVAEVSLYQRPDVEGPVNRRPFSLLTVTSTALPVRREGDHYLLDGGTIAGVSVGDIYGVMPAGSTGFAPRRAIARVEIEAVTAMHGCGRRITWENGASDLPIDAVAIPLELASKRRAILVEAPEAERPRIARAIATSAKLRLAEPGESAVLATLQVTAGQLVIRDAHGPLFAPAAYPARLGDAVSDLANLATAQQLHELPADQGIAAMDIGVHWGTVEQATLRSRPSSGTALGLAEHIAICVENRSKTEMYAHVFNIGLRYRITLLSSIYAGGIRLSPGSRDLLGTSIANQLVGLELLWPDDLPADQPRVDTLLVIFTAKPADLRVLETQDHLGDPGGASGTSLQRVLAQIETGERRSVEGIEPEPFAMRWCDYWLFPLQASLAPGDFELDDNPLGIRDLSSSAGAQPATISIRIAELSLGGAPPASRLRIDVLVCTRAESGAPPYHARTLVVDPTAPTAPAAPATPAAHDGQVVLDDDLVWCGRAQSFVDIYLWASPDAGDSRPLAELLQMQAGTRQVADGVSALQLPDAGPSATLALGGSLAIAHAARGALARISPQVAGVYRACFTAAEQFGVGRHERRRASTLSFAISVDRIGPGDAGTGYDGLGGEDRE